MTAAQGALRNCFLGCHDGHKTFGDIPFLKEPPATTLQPGRDDENHYIDQVFMIIICWNPMDQVPIPSFGVPNQGQTFGYTFGTSSKIREKYRRMASNVVFTQCFFTSTISKITIFMDGFWTCMFTTFNDHHPSIRWKRFKAPWHPWLPGGFAAGHEGWPHETPRPRARWSCDARPGRS